jgi:hypothetical protein
MVDVTMKSMKFRAEDKMRKKKEFEHLITSVITRVYLMKDSMDGLLALAKKLQEYEKEFWKDGMH